VTTDPLRITVIRGHDAAADAAWDAFVASVPGDVLPQTTLWATTKAPGYRSARVEARRAGRIVAGAQLLVRPLPASRVLGTLGYVPRGPLLAEAESDPAVAGTVLDALLAEAKRQRVRALVVQPARDLPAVAAGLAARGFGPSPVEVAPTATIEVDLTPEPAALLAGLRTDHRRTVRRAQQAGVTVRQGSADDLVTFVELYNATAQRQQFEPQPLDYFRNQWDVLHPAGAMALFLAEYEGSVLSAALLTCFGDRAVYRLTGWSGAPMPSAVRPNHLLQWTAMQWAREAGFGVYDLGGVDRRAAEVVVAGGPVPDALRSGPAEFKLGFGGRVTLQPTALWRFFPAVLAPARRLVDRLVREGAPGHRLLVRLRAG
jgi:lipid II:glycine glycyltransferase (peptidoglycan interpeptide bridge formation enzyme)